MRAGQASSLTPNKARRRFHGRGSVIHGGIVGAAHFDIDDAAGLMIARAGLESPCRRRRDGMPIRRSDDIEPIGKGGGDIAKNDAPMPMSRVARHL